MVKLHSAVQTSVGLSHHGDVARWQAETTGSVHTYTESIFHVMA